ncbi:MAG TPA: Rne/Rng family ribonuclease [Fibrobacteraceae bacterium]|nr:Rne/Rng family ribonuclease [Fibrobacteraceae bacterium]
MKNPKRGILISLTPYEKRIAIMEDGELAELVVEGVRSNRVLGNIYKGVVQKVLPGLKAAFVDIGLEKAGFLHQDDAVDRNILLAREFGEEDDDEKEGEELAIDQILKEGQQIMVQVVKEPISTKGARLTTHLSFAGRFLVCMPNTNFVGVSKKERDGYKRREFKKIVRRLKAPDVGYIVRTNGLGESESEIKKQMHNLESKWESCKSAFNSQPPETCIYQESDSIETTIREYFGDNTDYVYIDDKDEYNTMRDYLKELSPDKLDKIKLWSSTESLFEYFKIEDDYERTLSRTVRLPRGGNLVIEQTEALVSIDINTGPKVHGKDQAKNILETNLDACYEIAKQLRLRDIGGLVIIDLIDMETDEDRDQVNQEFKKAIRKDKAPISFLPISQFGLMEVTRKRVRMNLMTEKTTKCPTCDGAGHIYTLETTVSLIDRWMARAKRMGRRRRFSLVVSSPVVKVLTENYARYFHYLEHKHSMRLDLMEDETASMNKFYFLDPDTQEDLTELYNFS